MTTTNKKPTIEFHWDETLERELTRRLISYRALRQEFIGSLEQQLAYERHEAAGFIKRLRLLFESHAPAIAADSDIDAAVDRAHLAHGGARNREQARLGGEDFARLYMGDTVP
ncbi:MAG TPA: hypothetical protein VK961_06905 [Chthoniobacter sp.]|nr:hypothetical protein [Chthoniobacter sp.]